MEQSTGSTLSENSRTAAAKMRLNFDLAPSKRPSTAGIATTKTSINPQSKLS